MKRLLFLLFALLVVGLARGDDKFFVYQPTWSYPTMTARDLKFPDGVTMYYIHFSSHVSTTSPYFSAVTDPVSASSDSAQLHLHQAAFRDTVQNNGAKWLLSITAQDNNLGNIAGNATQRKAFVSSVCAYLRRKGYDGLDLDWESNLSAANVTAVIKEFRDTLDARQPTQNILVMATIPDPKQYSSWNFYNMTDMNTYLDAYFGMNYGYSITVYDESIAYLNHRCMFDCPYVRPTASPWNTGDGYIYGTFKHNGITKYIALGADTNKCGIGLWSGGTPMLNSSSSSVPGSSISYPTASFYSYQAILNSGSDNYDSETNSHWGIVGGRYTSWIDSAGAYLRTKWAKDTIRSHVFMLYDNITGFIATGQRYGRQPHFDAMVNAITSSPTTPATPTITITATSLTPFATVTPNLSAAQTYNVSGADLTANIVVTAPNADFNVSLSSGSGYGASVTLTQSGGTVSSTPVYVKWVRTTAGSSSGNITHTSTGAATRNTAVSGTATDPPAPVTGRRFLITK